MLKIKCGKENLVVLGVILVLSGIVMGAAIYIAFLM
jgi:hypothetical protein